MYQLIYSACANADYKQIQEIIKDKEKSNVDNVKIDNELFWSHAFDGAFKSNNTGMVWYIFTMCDIVSRECTVDLMLNSNIDSEAARAILKDICVNGSLHKITRGEQFSNINIWFIFLERLLMKYDYDYSELFEYIPCLTQGQITNTHIIAALNDCPLILHKLRQYVDYRNIESKSHTVLSINWRECMTNATQYNNFNVIRYVLSFNPSLTSMFLFIHSLYYVFMIRRNYYARKQIVDYGCKLLKQMPRYLRTSIWSYLGVICEYNCIDLLKMIDLDRIRINVLIFSLKENMRKTNDEYISTLIFNAVKNRLTDADIRDILESHRKTRHIPAILLWYKFTGRGDLLNIQETKEVLNQGVPIDNEHVEELILQKTLFDIKIEDIINDYLYGLIPLYDRNIVCIICSYDEFRLPNTG